MQSRSNDDFISSILAVICVSTLVSVFTILPNESDSNHHMGVKKSVLMHADSVEAQEISDASLDAALVVKPIVIK